MSASDLSALTVDAAAGVTAEQVATLNATEVEALGTDIANLNTAALASLTSEQVVGQ